MDHAGDGRPHLGDLERWASGLRAGEAAAQRRRARWLGDLAAREATLGGVLAQLAERGARVALSTVAGQVHHGRLGPLGADFCGLHADGGEVLVRLAAITAVRPPPGAGVGTGAGGAPPGAPMCLAEVLDRLVGLRARVAVRTVGASWRGVLAGVGVDLAHLRLDGGGGQAYVPLASVVDLSLLGSG